MQMLKELINQNDTRAVSTYDFKERDRKNVDVYNSTQGKLEGYDCPLCKNRGCFAQVVEYKNDWEVQIRFCQCMDIRKNKQNLQASGLSALADKLTFDKYIAKESWQELVKQQAKSFCSQVDKWFFIGGQPGSGKTHICTAITTHFLNHGLDARYMLWVKDYAKLRALKFRIDEYEQVFDRYALCNVLYIDDFLKGRPDDEEIREAFKLINQRYISGKITIISSEKSLADIINLDEALGSRIRQRTGQHYELNISSNQKRNYRLGG